MKHEGDNLRKEEWSVEPIQHATASHLIKAHHYSRSCALTSVYAHGLFKDGVLLGACLWMPPTKVAAKTVHENWRRVLTLSRLAIVPDTPRNAASYFLSRSVRLIREEGKWECLITYADTWQGHTGAIYRACNWEYLGMTKPTPVFVNGSGEVAGRKRGPKNYSTKDMESMGYKNAGLFSKHKYRLVLVPPMRPLR